jgi:hypothetical protein
MDLTHSTSSSVSATASGTRPSGPPATQETKPRTFFSLPRELRDEIYDIVHRYGQEAKSGRVVFRFPLTHVRNISRRFTKEYDMRSPATNRLVICQQGWSWAMFASSGGVSYLDGLDVGGMIWGSVEKNLPTRHPRLARLGKGASFTELEFNFDVNDKFRMPDELLEDSDAYSSWISEFIYRDHHPMSVNYGGQLHLRLFFRRLCTFDELRRIIAQRNWYSVHCSKINLIMYKARKGEPDEVCLLHALTLAIWTKDQGWQVEEKTIEDYHADIARAR